MRTLAMFLLSASIAAPSCRTVDLYERSFAVPGMSWEAGFQPEMEFQIRDTTARYRILFLIRHTDAYAYNNIWVNISSLAPGDTAYNRQRFEFPLASADRWNGSGMDDLREHRILLYREPVKFRMSGTYRVRLEQVMRENPLRHVMNVGMRIEKAEQ